MKRIYSLISVAGVAVILAACSSTPETIPELEAARAAVPKMEASPRAGVAASNISEARKALDRATDLQAKGKDIEDIRQEAIVAAANAEIANQKILTAQAKEEIEKGTLERQQVVLETRNAEARAAEQRAKQMEAELKAMKARETERGMILTLGDVLFDTGKATLKPGAYTTIDKLAGVLNSSRDRKVMIEGHTDSTGSDATNQALSQARAEAVQTALLQRGVQASQISAVGKGETSPVASNDTASGRQSNRRVELIFSQDASRVASD
jgi:outer membrane protein OmpA-like peptidoglycan-associated protein